MIIAMSPWFFAFAVWLCGLVCVGGYLLTSNLSRRLYEHARHPVMRVSELARPLGCGMLLGLVILLWHPAASAIGASAMGDPAPLLSALFCVALGGLCAGGWSARPLLGRMAVAPADLVRRLCIAGDTHEDATARVAVRLALAAGYDRRGASDLMAAASLHDIGTCGIPESILHKTGPLEPQEQSLLRSHTRVGHRMLARSDEPMLDLAADIALHHHERWDGGGYPGGLCGEAIPLTSRAVALAEAFVAMADRGLAGEAPDFRLLEQGAGRAFDPRLVALLLADLPGMQAAHAGDCVPSGPAHKHKPEATWLYPARFYTVPQNALECRR